MKKMLLTIVTVTKNCAVTIQRTLDSVSLVKSPSMEYVVVDGVSTDATLDIIRASGALVDRLISEPDNGIYNALNKAVRLARGRYVLFIHGDDALVSEGFPAVMDVMARGHDDIICATTLVGNLDRPAEALVAIPWHLPFFNSIPHPSSFVRRDLLIRSPFREDLRIASDYDFFLGAYLNGQPFSVLPAVTALHQRGGASGDVENSRREVETVRRERLGWRYPLINGVAAMYKQCKRAINLGVT